MKKDISNNYIKFYVYECTRAHYDGYSVGLKFYEKENLILDYLSELSRDVFFDIFTSSNLIDNLYLPIGGCGSCDDFGCERYVTKFSKNNGIIILNNIYQLLGDNTLSIIKEFYFEIEESVLVRNVEKLKNVII